MRLKNNILVIRFNERGYIPTNEPFIDVKHVLQLFRKSF